MRYMKITEGKFWGWVIISLVIGLAAGAGVMFFVGRSTAAQVASLKTQMASASTDASAAIAAAQQKASDAETQLAALTQQVTQLTADLQTAQNTAATDTDTDASDEESPTIAVTSRTVSPNPVETSATITLTAKVTGAPSSVTLRVYNTKKKYSKTYTLKKSSTSGDTQTWTAKVKAPGVAGSYLYYATATKGSVHVTMPGKSPSTLTVK